MKPVLPRPGGRPQYPGDLARSAQQKPAFRAQCLNLWHWRRSTRLVAPWMEGECGREAQSSVTGHVPGRRTSGAAPGLVLAGFSLIELMIVIAIVAVLAMLAYSSYSSYVTKTRRTAAQACLTEMAGFMERYYSRNLNYFQSQDQDGRHVLFHGAWLYGNQDPAHPQQPYHGLPCASPDRTGRYYTYRLQLNADHHDTYNLSATANARQPDPGCHVLYLDQTGARTATDSTGTPVAEAAHCWQR